MRYFEIGFGYKDDELFGTGDYEEPYSMAIKATFYPNFKEVEKFIKEDLQKMGYTGVNSITEIEEWEVHKFFDDDNFDNWPVLTKEEGESR